MELSASNLSGEIITGNYQLVYYVAENVGIIGILPYPKSTDYFLFKWIQECTKSLPDKSISGIIFCRDSVHGVPPDIHR